MFGDMEITTYICRECTAKKNETVLRKKYPCSAGSTPSECVLHFRSNGSRLACETEITGCVAKRPNGKEWLPAKWVRLYDFSG